MKDRILDVFKACKRDMQIDWPVSVRVSGLHHPPGSPGDLRDLAWTEARSGRHIVFICGRALEMARSVVEGLILHELGHAYLWGMKHSEADVDARVLEISGRRIYYSARGIQTTSDKAAKFASRPPWIDERGSRKAGSRK